MLIQSSLLWLIVSRFGTKSENYLNDRKALSKARHNHGITQYTFQPEDLVMLRDVESARKKLHLTFRGPFVVTGFAGSHGHSYTLRQINGEAIPRQYYGDHLKLFRLRTGHLVSGSEQVLPVYQNIRASRCKHHLPKISTSEQLIAARTTNLAFVAPLGSSGIDRIPAWLFRES